MDCSAAHEDPPSALARDCSMICFSIIYTLLHNTPQHNPIPHKNRARSSTRPRGSPRRPTNTSRYNPQ